jgi:hypothetical protein
MRWRGWTSCASAIVLDADNQWQHETLRLRGADGRFNEADFAKITVTDAQRRALADAADDGTRRAWEQYPVPEDAKRKDLWTVAPNMPAQLALTAGAMLRLGLRPA